MLNHGWMVYHMVSPWLAVCKPLFKSKSLFEKSQTKFRPCWRWLIGSLDWIAFILFLVPIVEKERTISAAAAPRLYSVINMSLLTATPRHLLASTRWLQRTSHPIKRHRSNIPSNPAKKDLTKEEIHKQLEAANETMKAYYSYPPEKVISMKKARFNDRHMDSAFYIQVGLGTLHLHR